MIPLFHPGFGLLNGPLIVAYSKISPFNG